MKKYLMIFTVLIMAMLMTLSGCSGSSDSSSSDSDNAGEENTSVIEDLTDLFSKSDDYTEEGLAYTQTMTMGDMTTTMKTWMKTDLYKTSISTEGQEMVTIFNYETDETIVYYPDMKTGMIMTLTDEGDEDETFDINQFQEDVDPVDFENLGMETVNGEECYVVESIVTSSSAKMWISKKYGIIMKMEVTDENSNEAYTYELDDLTIGVDDSEFEVPSDIMLQSFSF